ncbi:MULTISPECIES: adenylate/guanylate cyclase domain-containing protein [unclassified Bradyrhizobium]|uniref:AAA family ATPase n=1 Tax=unclassified Bradyrhizobium TaxID=2631580 RepID=UPI0024795CB0|nr:MULTISPECIES: adenylate/guanylate cyclase domain-containing protein [unclassified Bradyrhizobium]WGR70453.1 AAA family ATPase [Bradyrhizobium sp. ISRA426]WGR82509.1 AAA family ATPase [Bradyrhizobium sp. ISRA430]WGR85695.1 AAA family ATPase [Bradyrhizobium sp. ISRA432]
MSAGAERRQLTVMFCDLVGSTALASRLDPEDLREVIGEYHKDVARVVGRFDGFVAKYMGDGVLAYFGYPRAHEDDTERAIRAGLKIAAIPRPVSAAPGGTLRVRVGIATGLVVVGDLVGAGESYERGVVGETPNLAARLQALAEPGDVVIDARTHRLTGGIFDYEGLGERELKGFAAPVAAWRVRGEGVVDSRFEALHSAATLTSFVGREDEIQLVLRRWKQAKEGKGQVVLLTGEPGIGKSRLSVAFQERLADELYVRLRYFCSPHHRDSALYPTIVQLERAAGFERDDTPEIKFHKLETLPAPTSLPIADMTLLAELLQIPAGDLYTPSELNPQRKKEETFEALLRQLAALTRHQPLLMIYEDVHWIDPSSRELLDRVVDRVAGLPMLLLITFRPEFQQPWAGRSHVTFLALRRLAQHQGAMLVRRVAGDKTLPADAVKEIVDRTDGVPLFVEELTKAVLEDYGDSHGAGGRSISALAQPSTLQASLMARLDRLGAGAKQVAQTGAAIGREFSYELLSAIAGGAERELQHELARLVTSELVFQRGTPPESVYTFKHALVQDAAYSTLLRSDRQQLHARIAEAVERCFPERVAREPEVLAFHFMEARRIEHAIGYWLKAGERAAQRSANLEAIRHLSRGLEALLTLPDSPERDRRELAYQIALGTPLIAVHGYSAPQTGSAYSRARVLCERLGEAEPLVATLSGEFVYYFVRGDYPMMQRLSDEARQVSERLPNPVVRFASHRLAGITAMHSGAFSKARSEFETILRLYDARQHRSQPVHYVHDPKVSALTYLALVLWILGFPEQARHASAAAFRCAAELDQANLTAHVHNFAGAGLDELLGDVPGVRAHVDVIAELADRHSLGYWRVNGLILRGWVMVRQGAAEAGIALMCQNAAERTALGVSWYQARYLCMLAAAYAQAGQAERGLRVVAEAKDLVARNQEHMWEGELTRIEGELLRVQGASAPEIEACFAQAIATTRTQGAKSLELRAALSFAHLWCDQGRRSDARALLTPTFGWFTEGFETADLRAAKALLDELT